MSVIVTTRLHTQCLTVHITLNTMSAICCNHKIVSFHFVVQDNIIVSISLCNEESHKIMFPPET